MTSKKNAENVAAYRRRRRDRGLCISCPNKAGRTLRCGRCTERAVEHTRKRLERKKVT